MVAATLDWSSGHDVNQDLSAENHAKIETLEVTQSASDYAVKHFLRSTAWSPPMEDVLREKTRL
jgi:hypothetical protein